VLRRGSDGWIVQEAPGMADDITRLAIAVGPRTEPGGNGGRALADGAEPHPAILAFHLLDRLGEQGNGGARRTQGGGRAAVRLRRGCGRLRQQVFGVDEAPAGLAEAFGGLLLAQALNLAPLLPQP